MTATHDSFEGGSEYGVAFWVGIGLASPVLVYGALGVVDSLPGVQLTSFLRFFVGAAVVHDLLAAPAVCAIAWGLRRWLPAVALAPVQAALIVSALVGLISWPFVRGYGTTAGEPSFLSRNYTTSVLSVWSAVWLFAAVWTAVRAVRARHR